MSVSIIDAKSSYLYLPQNEIEHVGNIQKSAYQEAISQLPIPCVDIFLYDSINKTYFLVLRKDPPAKNIWWVPGGRIHKGETFFQCAVRKCKEEAGLEVTPIKNIGSAATFFLDSLWGTQTHSVNFFVLAELKKNTQQPTIDNTCQSYQWRPLDSIPEDPYVRRIYHKALKKMNSPEKS